MSAQPVYAVHPIGKTSAHGFYITRNGVPITGPDIIGAPAGHRTEEAAWAYVRSLEG